MAFDPFGGHRSKPDTPPEPVETKPAQAQPGDETAPAREVESPPANPFAQHELEPERPRTPPSAHQLLCWIQRNWGKPIVSLRDIQAYGPNTIRKRQITLELTKILVREGWLVPMKAWRHDRQVWRLPPPGANPIAETTQ
jgi:hypothetical protein